MRPQHRGQTRSGVDDDISPVCAGRSLWRGANVANQRVAASLGHREIGRRQQNAVRVDWKQPLLDFNHRHGPTVLQFDIDLCGKLNPHSLYFSLPGMQPECLRDPLGQAVIE